MTICTITEIKYPKSFFWAGIFSMPFFHLVFLISRNRNFYKLMGCGKGGSFSIWPDWYRWAIVTSSSAIDDNLPNPIIWYLRKCKASITTFQLEPIEGHGVWDKKQIFGKLPKNTDYNGTIAVLTRATIRLSALKAFWQHVEGVEHEMHKAPGFQYALGMGEVPLIKQATFSIWENKQFVKQFAYSMAAHTEVVQKTRKEDWYSEEMFVRFKVLQITKKDF